MSQVSSKLIVSIFAILLIFTHPTIAQPKQTNSFNEIYKAYQAAEESGDKKQTLIYAQDAFELGLSRFGQNHENTIALQYNLALAQSDMHRGDLAHQNLQEVKSAYSELYGNLSLEVFEVVLEQMDNLKSFPFEIKINKEIKDIAFELIEEAETFLDETTLDENVILDARYKYARSLATIDMDLNIFRKTLNILKDTREDILEKHGDENIGAIELGFLLGKFYSAMEKDNKAIGYMQDVLNAFENTDYTHPYELGAHAQLVQLLEKKGRSEEATKHCIAIGKMTPWSTDTDPIPLYREAPKFPANMARMKKDDAVVLEFIISETGFVTESKVIESKHKEFAEVAMEALSNFRYAPKVVDNKAVASEPKRIQFDFYLDN